MDQRVYEVQRWLNATYGGHGSFPAVTEDGITGNATIKAIVRGFQIETNVTVDGVIGNGTLSAIGTISANIDTSIPKNRNLVYLLQGAMYCKGYSAGGFDGLYGNGTINGIKSFESDAGFTETTGVATSKIIKALLNTESFRLISGGKEMVRTIQQSLNRKYSNHMDLIPCDGVYGKFTNKGLITALQLEIGVDADGIFGSGTLASCPRLKKGGAYDPNIVLIMQYALYCNRCELDFSGVYDDAMYNAVKSFQAFVGLTADGIAGKDTWASLLISCGNRDRKGTACDRAYPLTSKIAEALAADGRTCIGRYIGGGSWKRLTLEERDIIVNAGMSIFPIYQTSGNNKDYFNSIRGFGDAVAALNNAEDLGFKEGTVIYFAVDFDAVDNEVTSNILPYFSRISQVFSGEQNSKGYRVGVYGPRNICSRVSDNGYAVYSFVSDMSTGYSGNLGYLLPTNWAFDQISTVSYTVDGETIDVDNLISSGRDSGQNSFDALPPEIPTFAQIQRYDSKILSEQDRCVEAAMEAVLNQLRIEEENEALCESIRYGLRNLRRKEEYRYAYDSLMDENGLFDFSSPFETNKDEYTLEFKAYTKFTQEKINSMNKSDETAVFLASLCGNTGSALAFFMEMVEADRNGELNLYRFLRISYDSALGIVKSKGIESVFSKIPTLSEWQKESLCNLASWYDSFSSWQGDSDENTDYYVIDYNYYPGGSTSGDNQQGTLKVYVGDELVQLMLYKDGIAEGEYYVYMHNLMPRCIWYYKTNPLS